MHSTAVSFLESLGAPRREAWELVSMAKHGPLPLYLSSAKHVELARFTGWADRISAAASSLQLGGDGYLAPDERVKLAAVSGHSAFLAALEEEDKKLAATAAPVARKDAFITCKCKSSDVDIDQRQTRASDEPMTLFALCRSCGSSWVVRDGAGLGSIG